MIRLMDDETLIPTMTFRWVERVDWVRSDHAKVYEKVLQQRFQKIGGEHVWVDVPTVSEDETSVDLENG